VILGEQGLRKDIAVESSICNTGHYSRAFVLNDLQRSLFKIVLHEPQPAPSGSPSFL
jgi:hypothetical protein